MIESLKGLLEKVKEKQTINAKRGFSEEKLTKNVPEKIRKPEGKVSLLNQKNAIF